MCSEVAYTGSDFYPDVGQLKGKHTMFPAQMHFGKINSNSFIIMQILDPGYPHRKIYTATVCKQIALWHFML